MSDIYSTMWCEEWLKTLRLFSQQTETSNKILFQSLFNMQVSEKGNRLVLQGIKGQTRMQLW